MHLFWENPVCSDLWITTIT